MPVSNLTRITKHLNKHICKYWPLYAMVFPGVMFLVMFRCIPLAGVVIAFKDYKIFKGIGESPWVGFKHFIALFEYQEFFLVLRNTLVIAFQRLVLSFPVPVILAILLNEVRKENFKRIIQTIFYTPHFFSWVIISGLVFSFLSDAGMLNTVIRIFGGDTILFMQKEEYFRPIVVLTGLWKETGWNSIVYMAAIAAINPQLYESAIIDGAGRISSIIYITIPLLIPTIVIMFLINIGNFLNLGFDQIYTLLTPMTQSVGDIIDTFVVRAGIFGGRYSFATAVGLFQSFIGFILVFGFNKLANRYSEAGGLW